MEKMKKALLVLGLMFVLIFNSKDEVEAIGVKTEDTYKKIDFISDDNTIRPLAERVQWYYRFKNDRIQKRLWSFTYGYWKTNWIWI